MSGDGDFFEEDEPLAKIRETFEHGTKGTTRRPSAGQTERMWEHLDLRALPRSHGWTEYLDLPSAGLLTPASVAPTETVRN